MINTFILLFKKIYKSSLTKTLLSRDALEHLGEVSSAYGILGSHSEVVLISLDEVADGMAGGPGVRGGAHGPHPPGRVTLLYHVALDGVPALIVRRTPAERGRLTTDGIHAKICRHGWTIPDGDVEFGLVVACDVFGTDADYARALLVDAADGEDGVGVCGVDAGFGDQLRRGVVYEPLDRGRRWAAQVDLDDQCGAETESYAFLAVIKLQLGRSWKNERKYINHL